MSEHILHFHCIGFLSSFTWQNEQHSVCRFDGRFCVNGTRGDRLHPQMCSLRMFENPTQLAPFAKKPCCQKIILLGNQSALNLHCTLTIQLMPHQLFFDGIRQRDFLQARSVMIPLENTNEHSIQTKPASNRSIYSACWGRILQRTKLHVAR